MHNLILHLSLLAFGLTALSLGGHFLVRHTVRLSRGLGVKPLFLSIVILGMGTSAPEWFVTATASFQKSSGMALGNVTGSNIANILLILGLSGLFFKHPADRQITRFDLPVFLCAIAILWICSLDGALSRWECGGFLILFIFYLILLFKQRKPEKAAATHTEKKQTASSPEKKQAIPSPLSKKELFLCLFGLTMGFLCLFTGSVLTVKSSAELGRVFGLTEKFIGVFILSVGTSLPELAVSLQSALKKQGEMALGNVAGSNMFNTFFVLGSAGLIRPITVSSGFLFLDYPVLLAVTLLLLTILFICKSLPRAVSGGFLILYFAYIALSYTEPT